MADAHVTIQVTGAAASVNVNVNPASLQGPKGDAFTYEDFTPEQLEGLRGPQGIQGEKGEKGDAFEYDDFTAEQLEGLRGPQGVQGEQGIQGEKGDAFEYSDFTAEQLEGLRGPQGDRGTPGAPGDPGVAGEPGVGIADVRIEEKEVPFGNADSYVMTLMLTDGRKYSVDINGGKNGEDGETGPRGHGITSIRVLPGGVSDGRNIHVIEIWWTTGGAGMQPTSTSFMVYDGKDALVVQQVDENGTDAVSGAAVAAYVAEKVGSANDVATSEKLGLVRVGDNLSIDESGILSVETASDPEENNTKPITAAAVYATVGNIEILLGTI